MSTIETTAKIIKCPAAEYHRRPELSRSQLWKFRESARKFHAVDIGEIPADEPDEPMRLGSLTHAMMFDPDEVQRYIAIPEDMLANNGAATTKAAKEFKKQQEEAGKEVVTAVSWAKAVGMVARLRSEKFGRWCEDAETEVTIVWTDPETGIDLRLRLDLLIRGLEQEIVFDLKTSSDPSPEGFRYSVKKYGYWFQYAHYSEGCKALFGRYPSWRFAVIGSEQPHELAYPAFTQTTQDRALVEWRQTLREFADAVDRDDWRSPWDGQSTEIHLNDWDFNR